MSSSTLLSKQRLVAASDMYLAYCSFGAGRRASDVFTAYRVELQGVEDHKFITFGVVQVRGRRTVPAVLWSPSCCVYAKGARRL